MIYRKRRLESCIFVFLRKRDVFQAVENCRVDWTIYQSSGTCSPLTTYEE